MTYPNLSPIFGIRNTCAVWYVVLKDSSASTKSKHTSSSFLNSGSTTDAMFITILLPFPLEVHFWGPRTPYARMRTGRSNSKVRFIWSWVGWYAVCYIAYCTARIQPDSDSSVQKRLQASRLGESLHVEHSKIQSRDVWFSASKVQGK